MSVDRNYYAWIDALPHVVWIASKTGAITFLNRRWTAMTGLTNDEGLGFAFLQVIHPEDRARVQESWKQAVQSGYSYEAKFRMRLASGIYCRVLARAQVEPTNDVSDAPQDLDWVGTFTDIESVVYGKDDLILKQQFLEALLDNLSDGIVACDANGILTLFNAASRAFHNLPAKPIPPERWADHYDLYDAETSLPMSKEEIPLFRALKGEQVQSSKIRIVPKQGKARVLLSKGVPIIHPDGHQLGAVVAMQDITEQEKAEIALKNSERRFRAIFNQTFQFMGLLEPTGTILEVNQTALNFAGCSADTVIGQVLWEIPWWGLSKESRTKVRQATVQAAVGKFIRYEVEILGTNDEILSIDFSLKPISDDVGNVILLLAEGRDITERKKAESEILQLNTFLEERVIQRTAELEAKQYQNELLLQNEQKARADLETALTQLQIVYCRNEELLAREQSAKAELEVAIAQTASYTERLTLALDAAQMGTWDWDMVNDQTIWNPRHEAIFGYEPNKPNRNYFDWERRVHPEDLEWIHQATHHARDNHQPLALQYRIIWPDGSLHWIEAKGRFFYNASDNPIRMIGVVRDITMRRQTEEQLHQSQEQFRATFEQAAVGIAHVDLEGRWLRVNHKLCDIVGYSAEELRELTFQDITHPDDLETDLDYMRQLLANEIQTYGMEKRYFHKSGETVWIELTVSLVRRAVRENPDFDTTIEVPQYFISVIEEINDRKKDQAELKARSRELSNFNNLLVQAAVLLEERNQELDRFVHIVSHDLKAPLRAISNLSQWIEEDAEGELSVDNQRQMQLLRKRVGRMETMINGLLEYAKAGRTDTVIETVSVADLLAEVIDSLDPPRSFEVEIGSSMPTLVTKRLLLSQVFANLISNAIKHHNRPNGFIRISCQEKGDFYEFTVADNGPGIESKYHDKIFMIFQTIEPQTDQDSSGIGLSIVKKIVETEEGTIRLESELGKGTIFYFTWPKIS